MLNKIKRLAYLPIQYLRTKHINNEYIDWLTYANAGMLTKGNIYAMKYAIQNLPSSKPVLEIGSFCGLSTNVTSHFLEIENKQNKIITSDKWMFENAEKGGLIGRSSISHAQYKMFVKSSYMTNVNFFSSKNLPYTVEEISDEFFKLWQANETVNDIFGRKITLGGQISFCYIDGNHTYDYAKRDFYNTDKCLEKNGFILFDDSYDFNPFGLPKLMKEIKNNKNYVLVMKNPNYLFKKIT